MFSLTAPVVQMDLSDPENKYQLHALKKLRDHVLALTELPNTPMALKILDCLIFIKVNLDWIVWVHNNRPSNPQGFDDVKGVLRDHNRTAFHINGYENSQQLSSSFKRAIELIEKHVEKIISNRSLLTGFVLSVNQSDAGCMEHRLAKTFEFLSCIDDISLDALFHQFCLQFSTNNTDNANGLYPLGELLSFFDPFIGKIVFCNGRYFPLVWDEIKGYLQSNLSYSDADIASYLPVNIFKEAKITSSINGDFFCFSSRDIANQYLGKVKLCLPKDVYIRHKDLAVIDCSEEQGRHDVGFQFFLSRELVSLLKLALNEDCSVDQCDAAVISLLDTVSDALQSRDINTLTRCISHFPGLKNSFFEHTPFLIALVKINDLKNIRLLLSIEGIDPFAKVKDSGLTAFDIARMNPDRQEVLCLLQEKAGQKLSEQDGEKFLDEMEKDIFLRFSNYNAEQIELDSVIEKLKFFAFQDGLLEEAVNPLDFIKSHGLVFDAGLDRFEYIFPSQAICVMGLLSIVLAMNGDLIADLARAKKRNKLGKSFFEKSEFGFSFKLSRELFDPQVFDLVREDERIKSFGELQNKTSVALKEAEYDTYIDLKSRFQSLAHFPFFKIIDSLFDIVQRYSLRNYFLTTRHMSIKADFHYKSSYQHALQTLMYDREQFQTSLVNLFRPSVLTRHAWSKLLYETYQYELKIQPDIQAKISERLRPFCSTLGEQEELYARLVDLLQNKTSIVISFDASILTPEYQLSLLANAAKIERNTIYLSEKSNGLSYCFINLANETVSGFLLSVPFVRPLTSAQLNDLKPIVFQKIAEQGHSLTCHDGLEFLRFLNTFQLSNSRRSAQYKLDRDAIERKMFSYLPSHASALLENPDLRPCYGALRFVNSYDHIRPIPGYGKSFVVLSMRRAGPNCLFIPYNNIFSDQLTDSVSYPSTFQNIGYLLANCKDYYFRFLLDLARKRYSSSEHRQLFSFEDSSQYLNYRPIVGFPEVLFHDLYLFDPSLVEHIHIDASEVSFSKSQQSLLKDIQRVTTINFTYSVSFSYIQVIRAFLGAIAKNDSEAAESLLSQYPSLVKLEYVDSPNVLMRASYPLFNAPELAKLSAAQSVFNLFREKRKTHFYHLSSACFS
jgi:hypothetical protein